MLRNGMTAGDLQDAFIALRWPARHAYFRRGRWVVIAGSRSATGPTLDGALVALLAMHASAEA